MALTAGCGTRHELETAADPGSLALDARGECLYVACEGARTVQAWDVRKRKTLAEAGVTAGPLRLFLERDNHTLRVLCRGGRQVLTLHGPDLKLLQTWNLPDGPAGWAYDPENRHGWVCSPDSNRVRPFIGNNALPVIEVGREPLDLLLEPNSVRLWVADNKSHALSVIHPDQGRVFKQVPVRMNPSRLRLMPGNGNLLVLCTGQDAYPAASVIQSVDRTYLSAGLSRTVALGTKDFIPGPFGKRLFAVGPRGLQVINLDTGQSKFVATGRDPQAVAVAPDGSKVYVSSRQDQAVFIHEVKELFR